MIPDFEAIVSDYLRTHASVEALGVGEVCGTTPTDTDQPWIRVSMLDALDKTEPTDHLIASMLQLDCYASKTGGQDQASLLMRTVRAALRDLGGVVAGAVITDVNFLSSPRLPDTDFEPARERYALTVTVTGHS